MKTWFTLPNLPKSWPGYRCQIWYQRNIFQRMRTQNQWFSAPAHSFFCTLKKHDAKNKCMRASPCAHLPCMMGNVEKLTIPCIDSTECLRKFVWIECMRVVYFLMPTPKFSLRTQNCENFCGTFSTLSERFPSAHFHPWGICNCQWLRRPLGSLRGT